MKPKVFVGSSRESLRFANAVQVNLERDADVTIWTQDIMELSGYTMDSLIEMLNESDFGVFILGPDDIVLLRGERHASPRDNVILELGMFIGRLGRSRAFVIRPTGTDDLHIPTDLHGLTAATFDPARSDENYSAALGPACFRISNAIRKYDPSRRNTETELYHRLEKVLFLTLQEIADGTGIRVQDIGLHLWMLANQDKGTEPVLVRKVRVRIPDIASSSVRTWAKGVGVIGQCWESQSDVSLDLTAPVYQDISELNWSRLPSDARMGLNYNDFRETTRHFKSVFAVPLVIDEKFVGCISFNVERSSEASLDPKWTVIAGTILRRAAAVSKILLQ